VETKLSIRAVYTFSCPDGCILGFEALPSFLPGELLDCFLSSAIFSYCSSKRPPFVALAAIAADG